MKDDDTRRLDAYIPLKCIARVCELCHRIMPAGDVRKDLRLGRILCNDGDSCYQERMRNARTRAA